MTYDPDKHHRRAVRLRDFDYSQPGAYYVTLCTANRMNLFGNAEGDHVKLNAVGRVIDGCWNWLAEQYAYVVLDEYVVMPNHLHGIIVLKGEGNGEDGSR